MTPRIDADRLWASIEAMASIGAMPGGGAERLALTPADAAARQLFAAWCREAGCSVSVDQVANQFARRAGSDPTALPVMTGSHLDTTYRPGRFDGVFGVLAGLEVVRVLRDYGITTRAPVEVVNWTNEEGARFVAGCTGSKVFAGVQSFEEATAPRDRSGVSIHDALLGFAGTEPTGHPALAFIEAHVELGPELWQAGIPVGIVPDSMAVRGYDVRVAGQRNHIGTTPMAARRNALLGAAEVALAAERAALAQGPDARTNTTTVQIEPNSQDIIPDAARLKLDFRERDQERLAVLEATWRAECHRIAQRRGLQVEVSEYSRHGPVRFDAAVVGALRASADRLGVPCLTLPSWTGHDAVYVAQAVPTAMLFVPSVGGLGHNEGELSRKEDLEAATNVLLHAVLHLAGVV